MLGPSKLLRGAVLSLVTCLAMSAAPAWSHSGLKRAEPPAESALKRPPTEVKLWFSERLEPAYSSIQVQNERGETVDRRDTRIDPSNPLVLKVGLQSLERGVYTVIWRVLSVDSHVTEGRFTFRVE